jgi:hypothetical protein
MLSSSDVVPGAGMKWVACKRKIVVASDGQKLKEIRISVRAG